LPPRCFALGWGRIPIGTPGREAGSMRIETRLVGALAVGTLLALGVSSVALGTHARPGSSTPLRVPLVPAYNQCIAPNSTHVAPLTLPSCSNATLQSDIVTVGMAESSGFVRLAAFCIDSSTPPCDPSDGVNEQDLRVDFSLTDLLCRKVAASAGCPTATSDYTGRLIVRSVFRFTDHANGNDPSGPGTVCPYPNGSGGPPCTTATLIDDRLASGTYVTPEGGCVAVGSTTGSTCSLTTTLNTFIPDGVREFQRMVVSMTGFQVTDTGEDGLVGPGCPPLCGNGDETRVSDQGLFLP